MDVFRITAQEGYRYEDLTPENKTVIDGMRWLLGEMDGACADWTLSETGAPLHDRVYNSIALEAADHIRDWLEASILEMQISLAESQPEEVR